MNIWSTLSICLVFIIVCGALGYLIAVMLNKRQDRLIQKKIKANEQKILKDIQEQNEFELSQLEKKEVENGKRTETNNARRREQEAKGNDSGVSKQEGSGGQRNLQKPENNTDDTSSTAKSESSKDIRFY